MIKLHHVIIIFLALIASGQPAFAHGDIVYSARYYLPPGSPGHSNYHIYRIDANGRHREQLTYGNSDDFDPRWVGDGSTIEFVRAPNSYNDNFLMLMKANGASLKKIKMVNSDQRYLFELGGGDLESRPLISPDGQYALGPGDPDYSKLTNQKTGGSISIEDLYSAVWLSNSLFGELNLDGDNQATFTTYDTHGKQRSCVTLRDTTRRTSLVASENEWASPYGTSECQADPFLQNSYVVEAHANKSPVVYWLDPNIKTIRFLTNAVCEAWSPERSRFCACAFNGTTQYDSSRVVWTSVLNVVNVKTLAVTTIQGGLIDCNGADWRYGYRRSLVAE